LAHPIFDNGAILLAKVRGKSEYELGPGNVIAGSDPRLLQDSSQVETCLTTKAPHALRYSFCHIVFVAKGDFVEMLKSHANCFDDLVLAATSCCADLIND
jgi:hypothetical protein